MKTRLFAATSLALLLAACGQTPAPVAGAPVNSPTPAGTPIYQITFQGAGSETPSASAQEVGGVRGQALENAPEPLGFDARPLATSTFTSTSGGVSTRHLQATFRVTNTTAAPLRNLVFLPVVTADTDGDPDNNAQTPTVAGTPFRAVRYFDGGDASARAAALVPTQGRRLNVTTGEAVLDPAADPYLTGLDTGGLSVTPPAGLSATILPSGWQAADVLGPGESTNVTFAVDLPGVDPAKPAGDPYSFNLLVTGAQDTTGTATGNTLDPARLRGTLEGWNFGNGELQAQYNDDYSWYRIDDSSAPRAPLKASGEVDLSLPVPSELTPFLTDCAFTGEQTAPGAGTRSVLFVATSPQGDLLGSVAESTTDGRPVTRFYSDTAAEFRGKAVCGWTILDLDVRLVRGWNALEITEVEGDAPQNLRVRNLPAGARTTLKFRRFRERVEASFRDPYTSFTLAAGQSVTREVDFKQTGGISGEISLETSVPGVKVTPATLKLPSLSAGGTGASAGGAGPLSALATRLSPQALAQTLTFTADENAEPYYGHLDLIVKQGGVEVGRSSLYSFTLVRPSISAYVTYQEMYKTLARGENQTVTFSVSSQNGYSGTSTVTLADLPPGVTASTETVTLSSGSGASVTVQLTASAEAPLGSFTAHVAGPKVRDSSPPITVTVTPARVALPVTSFQKALPAPGGIWVLTDATYDGSTGNTSRTLLRLQQGQVVQRETVMGASTGFTAELPTPNGNVMFGTSVVENYTVTGYRLTHVRPDGTSVSQTFSAPGGSDDFARGVVDARGNLWFLRGVYNSQGGRSTSLMRADFETATVTEVAANQPFDSSSASLSVSPDGRVIHLRSTTNLDRIDTETAHITHVNLAFGLPYGSDALTDNSGNLYVMNGSEVLQIGPDGTGRVFTGIAADVLLGLDRAEPETLWLAAGARIIKLNTSMGTSSTTTLYGSSGSGFTSTAGGSPDGSGGLWAITHEQTYGNTVPPYYASLLK